MVDGGESTVLKSIFFQFLREFYLVDERYQLVQGHLSIPFRILRHRYKVLLEKHIITFNSF